MTNLKINDTQVSVNKMQGDFSDAKILVNLPQATEVKESTGRKDIILKRRQTSSPKLDENYASENKVADDKAISDYINRLPSDQKDDFLKYFPLILEEMVNDKDIKLSSDDKKAIASFCADLKASSDSNEANYVGGNSDRFNGIANIMMIIIKVFTDNMNTESIDELSQINETNLANTFLQKAQEILKENIKNNNDVLASSDKKKGTIWNPLKKSFWSQFKDLKFDVKVAIIVGTIAAGGSALFASEGAEAEITGAAVKGAMKKEGEELAAGSVEKKAAEKAVENEGKTLAKKSPTIGKRLKTSFGRLAQGAMLYFIAAMYLAKDEAQDISNKLQGFSFVSQYETGVINQNNITQQTAAKRMGDDSERISQSSGYVQQAISMFGQAYQFRA
ncbi:MAG: hypothetical protein WCT85_03045 [Parachlamydiales bacterium]|jgi:hypothetical protein